MKQRKINTKLTLALFQFNHLARIAEFCRVRAKYVFKNRGLNVFHQVEFTLVNAYKTVRSILRLSPVSKILINVDS